MLQTVSVLGKERERTFLFLNLFDRCIRDAIVWKHDPVQWESAVMQQGRKSWQNGFPTVPDRQCIVLWTVPTGQWRQMSTCRWHWQLLCRLHGRVTASHSGNEISGRWLYYRKEESMVEIIGVRFQNGGKVYYFSPDSWKVKQEILSSPKLPAGRNAEKLRSPINRSPRSR